MNLLTKTDKKMKETYNKGEKVVHDNPLKIEYKKKSVAAIKKKAKVKGLDTTAGFQQLLAMAEELDSSVAYFANDINLNGSVLVSPRGTKANPSVSAYLQAAKELVNVFATLTDLLA